ncbi:hypothetical protein ASPSYDRAFT_33338 [Aspergillus sydowii CBS 593.65]|uniref:Uncharacterized protein n=1 Tax=Aspergillus sydowii CBS 593.65 TaxID=1036612 RepID=A0A1L9TCR5_9EURO|nr:uncharacterized protein ASPSYDRAFT_33338 [Aspergillus sydowii CBS 593.65]OJJ57212.1 hypothetical protein ASPSYDRAFT_33338 [Aspergillus sydowii CBS 593.65]
MTGFRALWTGIGTTGMLLAFTVRRIHEGSLRASPRLHPGGFQHNHAQVCQGKTAARLFWSGLRLFLKNESLFSVQSFVGGEWHLSALPVVCSAQPLPLQPVLVLRL